MSISKDVTFKEQIKKSFSACRDDIEELKSNNSYLKQVIEQLNTNDEHKNSIIQNLQSQISTMQQTQTSLLQEIQLMREEFSSLKNQSSNYQINQTQVESLSNPTNLNYSNSDGTYVDKNNNSNTNLEENQNKQVKKESKKDPYEALLEFKAKTNKRELVKQKILTTVPNDGMILSELRFLFVEHFNYCSKATFYNYLKELEYSKQIRIEREHSKNIVYLQGMSNMSSKEQYNSQFNI